MKIIKLLSLLLGIVLIAYSCSKDELDADALTDLPPGVVSISPANNSQRGVGYFDVKVILADGTNSPLASATLTLSDEFGNVLGTKGKGLSGTLDSIILEGSELSPTADLLGDGTYVIDLVATDASGNELIRKTTFAIKTAGANHDAIWLAGVFNNWDTEGTHPLELVAANTWQISGVDLLGEPWKLKNQLDWSDEDWGDSDCDFVMESNQGPNGNADTDCGFSGLVTITFNDQTLEYTVTQDVTFDTDLSGLYLLGTFNNFEGSDYRFTLVDDNTWRLSEVELQPGYKFKFAEGPNFMGRNWGDNEGDGIAEEFGSNIMFMEQEGIYSITFNEKSLQYTVEFLSAPGFESIGLIGDATPNGWDGPDHNMTDNGDGTYSLVIDLVDGFAKFRAEDDWAVNWGSDQWPSGIGVQDGPNIPVVAGRYNITFNPGTGEYSFAEDTGFESIGIIGSATPGGWDSDTDMTDNGDGTYSLLIGLLDGEAKFRANNDWPVNWGATDFPAGTGVQDGPNIPVSFGLYWVTFNSNTGEYNFEPASVGIIGSATPGGWDSDTDMAPSDANPSVVVLNVDLVDGEAKFRLNNDWPVNWGAADFPTGVGVQDGPNIPVTAGNYDVSFNVLTGEYSFE